MSTLLMGQNTFAPSFASAARPALRFTRRGQIVVVALFLVAIAAVMVGLSAVADAGFGSGAGVQVRTVEVQPGQTLYDLARQVGGDGDIRDTVARIEELNSLPGPQLQVGQRIALPVGH